MKKIYLLPNFLTLCNLLCGYWAITFAFRTNFTGACVMIYFAMLFDMFDGKIARMTHTTSKFGFEFDSIADVVSFGVAPASIIYNIFLSNSGIEKIVWWGCFIYVVCGALRLARYNVQASNEEKEDFVGLPIPCAAGMMVSYILFKVKYNSVIAPHMIIWLLIPIALLMVSSVRYSSLGLNFHKRKPFEYFVAAVVCLGLLVMFPHQILLLLFSGYIIIGLFLHIIGIVFKKGPSYDQEKNIQV
jgi:CDP-diacylglycerol---serine O-phosphatidyltransferase